MGVDVRAARQGSGQPAQPRVEDDPARPARAPGPGFHRPGLHRQRPPDPGCAQPVRRLPARPPRPHGVRLDPPRGPGHRALRRRRASRPTRSTSTARRSSSWPSRAAATPSPPPSACSGSVSRKLGPQDPLHREAQPQRAAHLPQQVRPGDVRHGRAGRRPGGGRGRRHHLLRFRGVDRQLQEVAGPSPRPTAGHVHRALVLPAQLRVHSDGTTTTGSPPT